MSRSLGHKISTGSKWYLGHVMITTPDFVEIRDVRTPKWIPTRTHDGPSSAPNHCFSSSCACDSSEMLPEMIQKWSSQQSKVFFSIVSLLCNWVGKKHGTTHWYAERICDDSIGRWVNKRRQRHIGHTRRCFFCQLVLDWKNKRAGYEPRGSKNERTMDFCLFEASFVLLDSSVCYFALMSVFLPYDQPLA